MGTDALLIDGHGRVPSESVSSPARKLKKRRTGTMMKMIARMSTIIAVTLMLLFSSGCDQESQVAARNVSQAAHNFEVNRRCIFYNGITGEYILVIEGLLSVTESGTQNRLEVVVKTGPQTYKKHYLGLSDNVSYFVEQLEPVTADPFHYRVFFRPTTIIPDIETQIR